MNDVAKVIAAETPENVQQSPDQDLESPDLYLNRELTWLAFNQRVLREAVDERIPLLERLKFIAIVSSNIDEFFMKRIGGLKQQLGAGVTKRTVDGRTPQQQISECHALVRDIETGKRVVVTEVLEELCAHDICILDYTDLNDEDRSYLREYYFDNIFPLLTPQAIDPAHPFPFISNLSLNLLIGVRFRGNSGRTSLTRIKVPVGSDLPRLIQLPGRLHFVKLEHAMIHNLDTLLPDMEVLTCEMFRVTRNANTERSEDHADDLLSMIESELRERKFAPIVRMQIEANMDPAHRGMLAAELGLDEKADVFDVAGSMMAMRDLFELVSLKVPELHDVPHQPIDHPELIDTRNIFHIIRERGPFLLQHPYESFGTSVERFLRE
ncbi:MAG: RNA degradosome polyphosphate kinase, partial [Pseudomonadota bacterium]